MGNMPFAPRAATALAVVSLLILPMLVQAQGTPDPTRAGVNAVPPPSAAPPPRQVEVSVDWVDVPDTDVSVTNVGLGPHRDARLMAALVQNGAVDTQGPRLRTTTGVFGGLHLRSAVPTSVMINGGLRKTVLHLDTFLEVTPHLNPDGSISLLGGVQREELAPGVTPPAASTYFMALSGISFPDGETSLLMVDAAQKHYTFLTVRTVPASTVSRK